MKNEQTEMDVFIYKGQYTGHGPWIYQSVINNLLTYLVNRLSWNKKKEDSEVLSTKTFYETLIPSIRPL